ncbi:MAG TPA: polyprenyl synthetase family protein [Anaerolineae bacterium]|nr:polyprenyl synthetase family protein [Anaerolineae bacterium]HQH38922.1 polyprenyl synthetase family protein [Anaerolineae bacterium]
MESEELQYAILLRDELHVVQAVMLEVQQQLPDPIAPALVTLIQEGGKRLRPALMLLSAYLCGADIQRAIPVAAAIEMLHTATLIHDDLIDNAALRRGRQTLNAGWTPAATVLAGDVAFAWAAKLATRSQNLRLVQRFSETLAIICQGELNQMFNDRGHLSTETAYYSRIFAKTASLFILATEAGAILALQAEEDIARLHLFGQLLGEAFQIVDDVLDLMGDEAVLGKPVGSDLRQGIITLPVLYYSQRHPDDTRIPTVLNPPCHEVVFQSLVADLRRSDAADRAMQQATMRADEARALLAVYSDTPYRRAMEEIVTFAVRRQY